MERINIDTIKKICYLWKDKMDQPCDNKTITKKYKSEGC